ncbi:MAG TPA: peptide deformylase [Phycisphaerae bacterium]|nr:peptide deformylase [Phycisphaerae bacterium]
MGDRIDVDNLGIVFYPDPVLRKTCRPVERFDENLARLVQRMFELMRAGKGIGLAAPQVGVTLRLLICNPTGEPADDMVCINPELTNLIGSEEREEGCLSLPNVSVPMRRAVQARIRAYDVTGKPYERDGTDLLARVWQHENDHLDGRMIIDSMSDSAQLANRRALKQLQAEFKQSA